MEQRGTLKSAHSVNRSFPRLAQTRSLGTAGFVLLPRIICFAAVTLGRSYFAGALLVLLLSIQTLAQSFSATDGFTPSGIAPGTPLGSYRIADWEHINYFNGRLTANLPLMKLGGRGEASWTVGLNAVQPLAVQVVLSPVPPPTEGFHADYFPYTHGSDGLSNYGKAKLEERCIGSGWSPDDNGTWFFHFLSVGLIFSGPDGTEYDFIDERFGGSSQPVSGIGGSVNFGRVFYSRTDSRITYVSDFDLWVDTNVVSQPMSGTIYLPDGTRYRIGNGVLARIIDRNGNTIDFTFDTTAFQRLTQIKDSLNREVNFAYNINMGVPYGIGDMITYKGFGGAPRSIRITSNPGTLVQGNLFPELNNFQSYYTGGTKTVWMPDNRQYVFRYNAYTNVDRIELPTGGAVEYDYAPGVRNGPSSGVIGPWWNHFYSGEPTIRPGIYHRLVTRRVYPDKNSTVYESRQEISRPESISPVWTGEIDQGYENLEFVEVTTYDFTGSIKAHEIHHFPTAPQFGPSREPPYRSITFPGGSSTWADSQETKYEAFHTDGTSIGPLLRKVEYRLNNNFAQIDEIITTLADTNQVSKQTFLYDIYNNRTDVYEYDFGVGTPSAHTVRHTHTDYLTTNPVNGQIYDAPWPINPNLTVHIRNLPIEQIVYSVNPSTGAETQVAKTSWEYDNYTTAPFHWTLIDRPSVSGLQPGFNAAFSTRGNVTAISRWLNTSGGSVSSYAQYDIVGNLVKIIDPRSTPANVIATSFDFDDHFGDPDAEAQSNTAPPELGTLVSYAFPTKVTNALGHSTHSQFDYYLGTVVNSEDENEIVSSAEYGNSGLDSLDRLSKLVQAINDPLLKNQTRMLYDDVARTVTITGDLNTYDDNVLASQTIFDGLGRTIESRRYEGGSNFIAVQKQYDALGRAFKISNPFRPWQAENALWTTTGFDSLNRVVSVTSPDNAVYTLAYSGNRVLITDQMLKQRITQTDALGRLTEVSEITSYPVGTESVSFPGHPEISTGYRTRYAYDTLNDLVSVTQQIGTNGTIQTRSFVYDSLKRLTSSTNPESGTTSYIYDSTNVLVKTDARGVSTHYSYDALNRLVRRWYNGSNALTATANNDPSLPAGVGASDETNCLYDSQALPVNAPSIDRGSSTGRLVAVLYGGSPSITGSYLGFDALGRVKRNIQVTNDGQSNQIYTLPNYDYDRAGNLTAQTYPSGRIVTTEYDSTGRIAGVKNQETSTYYAGAADSANRIQYWSHGAVKDLRLGNGLWEHASFNARLQTTEIGLGTTQGGFDRLKLNYDYGTTSNNGNLLSQVITVPTVGTATGFTATQNYAYDQLNRLETAVENSGSSWTQNFTYDRYGNRSFASGTTFPAALDSANNPVIKQETNRIDTDVSGQMNYSYDATGNLTHDVAGSEFGYDAENRQTTYLGGASPTGGASYYYDAEGRRVKRIVGGPSPTTTVFVYDADGQLLAEYSNSISGSSGGTSFLTSDIMRTPRIITGPAQEVKARHDYMPFGEEIPGGLGGRTQAQQFVDDNVRQKFTSYERDDETGLDFAEARYFSNVQGRFTSADGLLASARRQTPQSWNRYSYAINNPLKYVDPSGEAWIMGPGGQFWWDPNVHNKKDLKKIEACRNGGCKIIDGERGVITTSAAGSGFIVGHLYTYNADSSVTHHGVYSPPPPPRPSTQYADEMALAVVGLYAKAGLAALTGGTSIVSAMLAGVLVASDTLVEEDGSDGETMTMAAGTVVYISHHADGRPEYVGITDDFKRRAGEQLRTGRIIREAPGLGNLSREEARAVEEALIKRYGFAKDGGSLSNLRHSISPRRVDYKALLKQGLRILKRVKFR